MKHFLFITMICCQAAFADMQITTSDGKTVAVPGDLYDLRISPMASASPSASPSPSTSPSTIPVLQVSADGAMIPPVAQIVDTQKSVWTVTNGVIMKDGTAAGLSSNVVLLLWKSAQIYQSNQAGGWWSWNGTGWDDSFDPRIGPNPVPSGIAPAIQAPLASAAKGNWQTGDISVAGVKLHSGKPFHYNFLLPDGYSNAHSYPILVYEHENTEGNNWYQGGGGSIVGQQEMDGSFNDVNWRKAYPAIVIVPYADQTDGTSGVGENFGGYNDSAGSEANERAVVGLVQYFMKNFSVNPNKIYITGDSLGGIGTEATMLDYNTVNGPSGRVFAAGLPFAGQIYRQGELAQATIARMANVPMFAVSGAGDTTSPVEAFNRPLWRGLAGNSNYPGPMGAQAGSSKYRYLEDPKLGHNVWTTYRSLPGGKVLYDWLFAQDAGLVNPQPSPTASVSPSPSPSPSASSSQAPSANDTTIPQSPMITDAQGHVWTVSGGVIDIDGQPAGLSSSVTLLLYHAGAIYQSNQAGGWWVWNGSGWDASFDPRIVSTGGFAIRSGQIIDPDGKAFIAKGINMHVEDTSNASKNAAVQPLTTLFPNINFVRLADEGMTGDPARYATFIAQATAKHIVVEIEAHPWPMPAPFSGSTLTSYEQKYAAIAKAYAANPYVWFGTQNEPQTNTGIQAMQAGLVNAVRGTGSKAIVMLTPMGGGNPGQQGTAAGMDASVYAKLSNVVWDLHVYGWIVNKSTDMTTIFNKIMGSVQSATGILALQAMPSADGKMPVIVGEFGDSTDGSAIDADGPQIVQSVINLAVNGQSSGFAAWHWSDLSGNKTDTLQVNGQLTAEGQQLAQGMAAITAQGH